MIRVGVLGAAGIAPPAMVMPARRRGDVRVEAVAARSATRADGFAAEHAIPRAFGSYDALLEDAAIDLVYVALPPSLHAEWTVKALEAGKHVLCEKPFALDAAEARLMLDAASRAGRHVIEAHHSRYHPLQAAIREAVTSGRLGRIESARGSFLVTNPFEKGAIRHEPSLGGGSLMDLGTYPLHWLRTALGEEPAVLSAQATLNPAGADSQMIAELAFPSGTRATLESDMNYDGFTATLELSGSSGTLRAEGVVLPHLGHRLVVTVDGVPFTSTVGGEETYDHQLAAVVATLTTGVPAWTEGVDTLRNMEAIDAVAQAAGLRR